jgi:predicted nucleic acid-binding protein
MKLLILDTNLFVRLVSKSKYYHRLIDLIAQGKVKVVIHDAILAEALSVLLKSEENKLFGRIVKERIVLDERTRQRVLENLEIVVWALSVEVVTIGKEEMDKTLEKVRDVCISAFDALTLVVADKVRPDLIATDDRLFRNRALQRGYEICFEEEIYEKLGLI